MRTRQPVNYRVDMELNDERPYGTRQDDGLEFEDDLSDSPAPKQQRTSRRQAVSRQKVLSESEEELPTDSDDGDQPSDPMEESSEDEVEAGIGNTRPRRQITRCVVVEVVCKTIMHAGSCHQPPFANNLLLQKAQQRHGGR